MTDGRTSATGGPSRTSFPSFLALATTSCQPSVERWPLSAVAADAVDTRKCTASNAKTAKAVILMVRGGRICRPHPRLLHEASFFISSLVTKASIGRSPDFNSAQKLHDNSIMLFRMLPLRPVSCIRHTIERSPEDQRAHVSTDVRTGARVFIRPQDQGRRLNFFQPFRFQPMRNRVAVAEGIIVDVDERPPRFQ